MRLIRVSWGKNWQLLRSKILIRKDGRTKFRQWVSFRIARDSGTISAAISFQSAINAKTDGIRIWASSYLPGAGLEPCHNHVNVIDGISGSNLRFPPVPS